MNICNISPGIVNIFKVFCIKYLVCLFYAKIKANRSREPIFAASISICTFDLCILEVGPNLVLNLQELFCNETTIVRGDGSVNNISSQWRNVLRDKLRRVVSVGRKQPWSGIQFRPRCF